MGQYLSEKDWSLNEGWTTWESSQGRRCWRLSEAQNSGTRATAICNLWILPCSKITVRDWFFFFFCALLSSHSLCNYFFLHFFLHFMCLSFCASTLQNFTSCSIFPLIPDNAYCFTKIMDVPFWDSEVYFEIKRQFKTICSSLPNYIRTVKWVILSVIGNFFKRCEMGSVGGTATGSHLLIGMFIDVQYCMFITCE